ncbi:MAG: TetR family transcriptional regulator [Lachnospiraceae bacterium]|nr:TetR family transcriptional regulator [Lachnospiraceae bacterium]
MKDLTKKHIAENMKELMRKKPLAKIRTTEICDKAQIDRSTFYYHFRDKYDLVAWIFYDSAFSTDILDKTEAAVSLRQVKKDYLFYKRANEDSSQNPLWQYMLEYYAGRYMEIAREKLGTDALDKGTVFSIRLYSYGTIAMSREWAFGKDPTPAEEVVELMYQSMPQNLRDIFFPA